MPELKLIIADRNISSWSLRPWLAMRMAGIEFAEEMIMLGRPTTAEEISRVSPSGWIPCLVVDGKSIWDSLAIVEFVAELFPEKPLWPGDRWARAIARSVVAEMHSGFRSFPTDLRMSIGSSSRRETPVLEGRLGRDVERIKQIWRCCRSDFGGSGKFLFGEFSIADAFFAPVVSRFETYGIPVEPVHREYMDAIWALEPMKEWREAAKAEISRNGQ